MTNIKDLAKMANVSVSTVSRVLNNHPYVKEEKRLAVLEAIKKCNYQQNINAVHLSKGKTQLVGVVLPFTDLPYFGQLLKGIANQALEHNYKLIIFQTNYIESRELEALQMLKQKQIDSLIICSRTCNLALIQEYLSYGPIVLCEKVEDTHLAATFVNHYQTFMKALDYLYEKGHRRIGYTLGRKTGTNSRERQSAYADFIKKYQLPNNPDYIITGCYHLEDGAQVVQSIQAMSDPPSALLVTSDQVAAGIVAYCQNQQIAIPDELALIGFDNQPIAKMLGITTIEIPIEEIGKSLFLQAVNEEISSIEMEAKLIERGTV